MNCPARQCTLTMIQTLKAKTARLLDPITQAEGLTTLQTCVLLHLRQRQLLGGGPAATVGDISGLTGMGQANTSALCKKLEQDGFLTRIRSDEDRRVVTLSLTERGLAAVERFQTRMDGCLALLKNVPQDQKDDLARGVRAAEQILDYLYEQTVRAEGPEPDVKGE